MMSVNVFRNWKRSLWQVPTILLLAVVIGWLANSIRSDAIPLVADWSPEARLVGPDGRHLAISLDEAQSGFRKKALVFIDARSVDDFASGHIQGAISLPWSDVDARFMDATAGLSLDAPIVTYCDGKTCALSKDLALFLSQSGFANVRVLVNGWSRWKQRGLPVETGGENKNG
jgi:rhodanese-related sulfurtransferase